MRVAFEALTEQPICSKKRYFLYLKTPPSRYDRPKKVSFWHFRFKYPTPPRKWSNSPLPWHKWWSNTLGCTGRMFLSVHDTTAYQEINCFSLEKPKVKRESPQKTHLFIFRCTLTTVPFSVLSRRQQKYKSHEKITDLISRRNESKEAWRRVLKDIGVVVLHKNHSVVFPRSGWTFRLPAATAASIKIT